MVVMKAIVMVMSVGVVMDVIVAMMMVVVMIVVMVTAVIILRMHQRLAGDPRLALTTTAYAAHRVPPLPSVQAVAT